MLTMIASIASESCIEKNVKLLPEGRRFPEGVFCIRTWENDTYGLLSLSWFSLAFDPDLCYNHF